jgi:hypothetical protein
MYVSLKGEYFPLWGSHQSSFLFFAQLHGLEFSVRVWNIILQRHL